MSPRNFFVSKGYNQVAVKRPLTASAISNYRNGSRDYQMAQAKLRLFICPNHFPTTTGQQLYTLSIFL